MIVDPKRLFDEEDADLSAAIGAARRRVPSRDRLNGIAERLAQAGVVVPPEFRPELSVSEMPAAATVSSAASKGVLIALGVAGVALIGVLASIGFGSRSPSTPAPVAPSPPRAERNVEAAIVSNAAPGVKPNVQGAPSSPEAVEPSAAPKPEGEVVVKTAPNASAAPRKAAEPAPPQNEIELLKRARSALSSEPSQSLELVERARQSFPRSAFGQEREFIAISALYKLGRRGEASARERAFRERHPRSAYLPQLDRLSSGP